MNLNEQSVADLEDILSRYEQMNGKICWKTWFLVSVSVVEYIVPHLAQENK